MSYITGRIEAVNATRNSVTGGWTQLHNEQLQDLYFLPHIIGVIKIKTDEMGGACRKYRMKGFWWANVRKETKYMRGCD